jgi:isopentenyl-diphosphate delta-isomerase type 1
MATVTDIDDLVTLVDEAGTPCGTAPRATVHQRQTPLHLAFSCYVTPPSGEVLMTRRALTKAAWPGVWTNSCCGHPKPGESVESAVVRRVHEELGLELAMVEPLIPGYRYTAVDAAGIMENEICPVYLGIAASGDVDPDPGEVAEFRWSRWPALHHVAEAAPWLLSPWAHEQISLLGPHRLAAELPPSSRHRR